MARFWTKLLGRTPAPDHVDTALRRLFADYPANPPRHAGDTRALSEALLDDNLVQFLGQREERLAVVGDFLRGKGVDPAPMLTADADAGVEAARAIDGWLNDTLPRRPFSPITGDESPNPPTRAFYASDRRGADIYFSFLADLGLLEGEAVRLRDPRFDWAINRLPDFADMESHRRICLIKPGTAGWSATVIAMDEHVLAICHPKMAPRGNDSGRWFGEVLHGAIERGFDPR